MGAGIQFPKKPMSGVHQMEGTINQPDPNARFRQNPFPGMGDPNWGPESTFPAATPTPSGGSRFDDPDFWNALKEQLEGAGENYDKADQPFKSLTATKSRGQVPIPKPLMPSLMGGTPTGGSYNPYLAKRKRAQ